MASGILGFSHSYQYYKDLTFLTDTTSKLLL